MNTTATAICFDCWIVRDGDVVAFWPNVTSDDPEVAALAVGCTAILEDGEYEVTAHEWDEDGLTIIL